MRWESVRIKSESDRKRARVGADQGHLELFGALWSDFKLITGSPFRIRWGTDRVGNAAALGRFDAGPPLPPGGHQGSPWFDPRGPFPPVHPEYRVGLGTARRRQRVEAGADAHARLHPRLTATLS